MFPAGDVLIDGIAERESFEPLDGYVCYDPVPLRVQGTDGCNVAPVGDRYEKPLVASVCRCLVDTCGDRVVLEVEEFPRCQVEACRSALAHNDYCTRYQKECYLTSDRRQTLRGDDSVGYAHKSYAIPSKRLQDNSAHS